MRQSRTLSQPFLRINRELIKRNYFTSSHTAISPPDVTAIVSKEMPGYTLCASTHYL
jgi:hypothetical protein